MVKGRYFSKGDMKVAGRYTETTFSIPDHLLGQPFFKKDRRQASIGEGVETNPCAEMEGFKLVSLFWKTMWVPQERLKNRTLPKE